MSEDGIERLIQRLRDEHGSGLRIVRPISTVNGMMHSLEDVSGSWDSITFITPMTHSPVIIPRAEFVNGGWADSYKYLGHPEHGKPGVRSDWYFTADVTTRERQKALN